MRFDPARRYKNRFGSRLPLLPQHPTKTKPNICPHTRELDHQRQSNRIIILLSPPTIKPVLFFSFSKFFSSSFPSSEIGSNSFSNFRDSKSLIKTFSLNFTSIVSTVFQIPSMEYVPQMYQEFRLHSPKKTAFLYFYLGFRICSRGSINT